MPVTLEVSPLPKYVFLGSPLEISLFTRSGKALLRSAHRVRVSVVEEATQRPIAHVVDPALPHFLNGVCSIILVISEPSVAENGLRPSGCVVVFELIDERDCRIICQKTDPLICVRHQLRIYEENSEKYEFFKDIGGKDKGIEFRVSLLDESGRKVHERDVAITPVLLYESGARVQDQNILQTADDKNALFLGGGEVKELKFRINQVSSKHLNQAFCIQIAPDLERCPDAADVMPAISVAVEVKSKIKRPQSEAQAALRQADQFSKRLRAESASDLSWDGVGVGGAVGQLLQAAPELGDAASTLRQWSHEVAVALESKIKWKPIGYQSVPGHKARVLMHEMQNPNETVQGLLQGYRGVGRALAAVEHMLSVMDSLRASTSGYSHMSLPASDGFASHSAALDRASVAVPDAFDSAPAHHSHLGVQRLASYPPDVIAVMDEAVYTLGGQRRPNDGHIETPLLPLAPSAGEDSIYELHPDLSSNEPKHQ